MPGRQLPIVLSNFGALGQSDNASSEDARFVEAPAVNAVIDIAGRLAAREGYSILTTSGGSSQPVAALAENIDEVGASSIVSAQGLRLYAGTSTLVDVTGTASPTGDDWFFSSFLGRLYGFQAQHTPIVYDGVQPFRKLHSDIPIWTPSTAVSIGDVRRATSGYETLYFYVTTAGTTGTVEPPWPNVEGQTVSDGTVVWTVGQMPDGPVGIGAFGRLWATRAANRLWIEFSDLLIPWKFRGGTGGRLDLREVWGRDGDTIQALATLEDGLVIFGQRNIAIFARADDVTTMSLAENISGIGTRWPKSVVSTGNDLLFLSDEGVWSLQRRLEAGRNPIARVGSHADRRLSLYLSTATGVTAAYDQRNGRYLLSLRGPNRYFVYDLRGTPARVTEWTGVPPVPLSAVNGQLYFGTADGRIAQAGGFQDAGSPYTISVKSPYLSMAGVDASGLLKIPKSGKFYLLHGGLGGLTFNWTYDFGAARTFSAPVPVDPDSAEWGLSEWGEDEWSGGYSPALVKWQFSGHGTLVQIGLTAIVNGGGFSIQQAEIDTVIGRIS